MKNLQDLIKIANRFTGKVKDNGPVIFMNTYIGLNSLIATDQQQAIRIKHHQEIETPKLSIKKVKKLISEQDANSFPLSKVLDSFRPCKTRWNFDFDKEIQLLQKSYPQKQLDKAVQVFKGLNESFKTCIFESNNSLLLYSDSCEIITAPLVGVGDLIPGSKKKAPISLVNSLNQSKRIKNVYGINIIDKDMKKIQTLGKGPIIESSAYSQPKTMQPDSNQTLFNKICSEIEGLITQTDHMLKRCNNSVLEIYVDAKWYLNQAAKRKFESYNSKQVIIKPHVFKLAQ